MRSTVLGSSGYVGAALVEWLRSQGQEVFTPARGSASILSEDLGVVYYCSGMVGNFLADAAATLHAHVNYLEWVLRGATFERIVYLSSCRLYDARGGERCMEDEPLALTPSNPRHLFDLSKGLGENLCLTQSGGRGCVARLACVYDDSSRATGFLPNLLRRLRLENDFEFAQSAGAARDYIAMPDVLKALQGLGESAAVQSVVNVASGENVSNAQLRDCLGAMGWRLSVRTDDPPHRVALCDNQRLREALGIQPQPVRDWLRQWASRGVAPQERNP